MELANFTPHLKKFGRVGEIKTHREDEHTRAHTLTRVYPASTPRRDIVMRLRDAVGRPSMRDTRRGIPSKSALLLPRPLSLEPAHRLDSPENIRGVRKSWIVFLPQISRNSRCARQVRLSKSCYEKGNKCDIPRENRRYREPMKSYVSVLRGYSPTCTTIPSS